MKRLFWLGFSICAAALLNSGCGGSSPPPPPPALLITSGTPPQATLRTPYGGGGVGFALTATGGVSPYSWTWAPATGSALPPGLTLAGSMISGTPSTAGTFTVVVTVTDSESPAKHSDGNYTIEVVLAPLTITTASLRNGTVGLRYNPHCRTVFPCRPPLVYGLQMQASGGMTPYTWSWAAASGSALPPGFSLSTSGLLDGTPTTIGTYNLLFTVTDAQSPAAQATTNLSLTVVYPPPPAINTAPAPPAGAVNLPYAFTFTASGTVPIVWSETGALPSGLAFGTDGSLTGKPKATGSFPITLVAQDKYGQNSAPQDFTIQVFPHGFAATGSMGTPRQSHTATLLQNGKLLVAGGIDDSGAATATAEIFDPAAGTFTPTSGSMTTSRYAHTATLLSNGKVLLTGGADATGTAIATAELFDPGAGTFTATTGNMTTIRYLHTATLLANGNVLLVGGLDGNGSNIASAEVFDAATGTFTATSGSMSTGRSSHAATLLASGKVLITGGLDSTGLATATAEVFDPATGTFSPPTGNMAATRAYHTATFLPASGKVLVIGGQDATSAPSATGELFDPNAGTFTSTTGVLGTARQRHMATLLTDGTVLVTGGLDINGALQSAELCDPSGGTFSLTGSLTSARYSHTATILTNGRVLVTGGVGSQGAPLATAELYQ